MILEKLRLLNDRLKVAAASGATVDSAFLEYELSAFSEDTDLNPRLA